MSQLAFSFDDRVTPINMGARVGRKYPRAVDGKSNGAENGLLNSTGSLAHKMAALDYFTNAAARTGWGTNNLIEATEYEMERLSYDYWLLITLYRNHWISRKIVDVPAIDMVRAWPTLTSEIDPKDLTL